MAIAHHHIRQYRIAAKVAFFALFLFAPLLDIFRFDLLLGHFILFGQPWTISIEPILQGGSAIDATLKIFARVLLPGIAFVVVTGWLIWRYGRIYCGWLCPHFSVVELINSLMLKLLSRVTLWEQPQKPNHSIAHRIIIASVAIAMAFIWALGLLSYLLPPKLLLHELLTASLGFGSTIFLIAATAIFTIDFVFARHIFCKYGCALGLFQSLIWMANRKAMVIKFDRQRAKICRTCSQAHNGKPCEQACPMRLPPRNMKRAKFTCTQCGECISACSDVQKNFANVAVSKARAESIPVTIINATSDTPVEKSLLSWVVDEEAKSVDRAAIKVKTVR